MCSNYNVSVRRKNLEDLGIKMPASLEDTDIRIWPYNNAPVIVKDDSGLRLVGMQFSLVPSFSDAPKVKYVTYNARLETVATKPAFKNAFKKMHCIAPMNGFYESVREGDFAGNVIQFKKKQDSPYLFAASIFDIWTNPEDKKQLFSYSILTSEPSQFIKDNGHDRTPIFLNFEDAKKWLSLVDDPKAMTDFLNTKLVHPELDIEIDRPLKEGWDKA